VTDPETDSERGFPITSRRTVEAAVGEVLKEMPDRIWSGELVGEMRTLEPGEREALLGLGQVPDSVRKQPNPVPLDSLR
jgi:hypothetical protein